MAPTTHTIKIWNIQGEEGRVHVCEDTPSSALSVAVSADGRFIVSGSDDTNDQGVEYIKSGRKSAHSQDTLARCRQWP